MTERIDTPMDDLEYPAFDPAVNRVSVDTRP
jgi:hypothetical protein